MESKSIGKIIAAAGLVMICGLCGLTAYGTVSWLRGSADFWDVIENNDASAIVTENQAFAVYANLEITSDYGNIRVTAADVDQIEVEMNKTGWGLNEADAAAAAAALSVDVVEGVDSLSLTFHRPDKPEFRWISGPDRIDFIVRVPAETAVKLKTAFGEVVISGLAGDAEIESEFGALEVTDLIGGLVAHSSNADISVDRVDAGEGIVDLDTSFGDILVESVSASAIQVHTSNGSITANTLDAQETVTIENQFGRIEVNGIMAAVLKINNSNGAIQIEGGELAEAVEVENGFGDISVAGLQSPSYTLKTSNGDISLDGAAGSVVMVNDFGSISITNAVDAILDITTGNGRIEFSGSLAQAAHSLKNSFGDIRLDVPADSAFDVNLETEFGDIESEIPLTLTGALNSGSNSDRWDAEMNGGGPLLEAVTSNGDIVISVLSPSDG